MAPLLPYIYKLIVKDSFKNINILLQKRNMILYINVSGKAQNLRHTLQKKGHKLNPLSPTLYKTTRDKNPSKASQRGNINPKWFPLET